MILDITQITTAKYPYYSLLLKDNTVIGCVKDPSFACEESECEFKRVCCIFKGKSK